ncbi:MAG TPA: triose-phosphate isomerase [Syntrophales bacterium]|nr:triose-phosphate isomerase [Syntrophales bacterium]
MAGEIVRRPLIIGNWKMNKTIGEAVGFARALAAGLPPVTDRDAAIAPPFTALYALAPELRETAIALCAQDVHGEDRGAFTGEVSAPMLRDVGCRYGLAGHSERRRIFGETGDDVNRKVKALLRAGLTPVLCVGETLEERDAEQTYNIVRRQLKEGLNNLSADDIRRSIVAYEPVWAIGTGRTATPDQAQDIHHFIRQFLGLMAGQEGAEEIRILYGGSVSPENAGALMAQKDIDGVLVGGASLDVDSFRKIILY